MEGPKVVEPSLPLPVVLILALSLASHARAWHGVFYTPLPLMARACFTFTALLCLSFTTSPGLPRKPAIHHADAALERYTPRRGFACSTPRPCMLSR